MRFYGVVFAAVAVVVILGLCVGCSADVTDSEVAGKVAEPLSSGQIVTEQLNFPAGVAARSVALGASNSLVLADSVEVLPVNGTLPLVTNTGSTVFNLGANARVGGIYSRGGALLRSNALVNGDVRAAANVDLQAGAQVLGEIDEQAVFDPLNRIVWTVQVPAGNGQNIQLEPDQTQTLAPGRYGNISVKSRSVLKLSAGDYAMEDLFLEPSAVLEVPRDRVRFIIGRALTFRGAVISSAPGATNVLMTILGTNTSVVEAPLRAIIVAPRSRVVIGSTTGFVFEGSVFAKDIEVKTNAKIRYIPLDIGFGTPQPPPPRPRPDPLVTPMANCGPRKGLARSAWPMQAYCPAHLGLGPFLGTRTNLERWRYGAEAGVTAQPVIDARGTAYVGGANGIVHAVDTFGRSTWKANFGAAVSDSGLITHLGDVVVPGQNGSLRAYTSRGAVKWTSSLGSGAVFAPTIDDTGQLYAATSTGTLAAVRPTGAIAWSVSITPSLVGPPTLASATELYVATAAAVHKRNPSNGASVWSTPIAGTIIASPIAGAGGKLYVVTSAGRLHALSPAGAQLWSVNLGRTPSAPPALAPDGTPLVPTQSGALVAVEPNGSGIRWTATVSNAALRMVAVGGDGVAYSSSASGALSGIDTTGRILWSFVAPSALGAPALRADGAVLVGSASGLLFAIGSDPRDDIGDFPNPGERPTGTDPSGLPWNPAVKRIVGDGGAPPWNAIARMPGLGNPGNFGDLGTPTNGMPNDGQEGCTLPSFPPNVTSEGLGGLGYVANADGTGRLVVRDPGPRPARCNLKFCQEAADGSETPIDIPFTRLTQNPSQLPNPTACADTAAQPHCPVDPETETTRECDENSDCNVASGEVCGVFCDDVTCETFRTRCGLRLAEGCDSLPPEPAGPFNPQDPSTWPCEDIRECAETGPVVGYTGDPALQKHGALNQFLEPPAGTTGEAEERFPGTYPHYTQTLNQSECNVPSLGTRELGQFDPRSGGSGNSKWGIFVEPDVQHEANVDTKSFLGDDSFGVSAGASFRAGARAWGHEIEAINGKVSGSLTDCTAEFVKSLKVFKVEVLALSDGDGLSGPTATESSDCRWAVDQVDLRLRELKKALHDARVAWDLYRLNGNVAPQALCDRTRQVFGNIETGCTVASARIWITRYESLANDLSNFYDGFYQLVLASGRSKQRGSVPFGLPQASPFTAIGASFSYPVGPVFITLEVEVAGSIGAVGSLEFGMDPPSAGQTSGPFARAQFTPNAEVRAYVFAGVGVPGVSVGVQGELLLLGVSVPLWTGVDLQRDVSTDPRSFSSSGLFALVGGRPGLLGGSTISSWTAGWEHGSGFTLESMSGRLDLAARVRLLFFKKTFRKKIADWKGFVRNYEFIGRLGSPMTGSRTFENVSSDIPFPEPNGVEAAFNATPVGPNVNPAELGPTWMAGICGNPLPPCRNVGVACVEQAECCTGICRGGRCAAAIPQIF